MQESLEKIQTLFQGRHRENISLHGEVISWGGERHKNKVHFKGIIKLSKVPSYQSSPISKYTRIFCCRGKDGYSNQLFRYKTSEFDIFL